MFFQFFHVYIDIYIYIYIYLGFSGGSGSKESACNAGDPDSIPASGRSPREGIGYPLLFSWTSRAAHVVKNLPAMQEIWV